MDKNETKISLKYHNENAIIPTNEFMQMFMLTNSNCKKINFLRDSIMFCSVKNIDNKSEIEIYWELVHLYKDMEVQQKILKMGKAILKNKQIREKVKRFSTFTREEILMYLILFNHYVENKEHIDENGNIVISIKEIHCKYRNKTLKMYSQIDNATYITYLKAINALGEKTIHINTSACKDKIPYIKKNDIYEINDKLLTYKSIKSKDETKVLGIRYNLGKFGDLLIISKRMTSKFPVELLESSYKQIEQVFIGLYISKIIYINQNKRKFNGTINLSIPSIMNNIMYYDKNGENTSQTLLQRFNEKGKQNYKLIKNFEKILKNVLELYKKHNFIMDFEVDSISVANYKLKSTKAKIIVK